MQKQAMSDGVCPYRRVHRAALMFATGKWSHTKAIDSIQSVFGKKYSSTHFYTSYHLAENLRHEKALV